MKLSSAIRSPLKEIILLAAHTGMRRSEILSLEWSRVKIREGYIELTSSNQKNKKWGTVDLTDTAQQVIRSIPRIVGSPWVFPSPRDHMKYRKDFKRLWARAIREAGIKQRSFKSLRHTTASLLAMDGADLTTIKEVMRHQDIKTTMRYSHLTDEHKRAVISRLDSVLKAKPAEETILYKGENE